VNTWRKKLNDEAEKNKELPKVSVNDIVMMAAAKALANHPQVNASWEGENIRQFGNVHMAMAVALPTGLITPVIRHCDQLAVRGIAMQSRELAGKAKAGSLKPEDYAGGTFTVSNLGMLGIEEFTAIINPPQAAILAVGATIMTPIANDKGEVVVIPQMKMTMSCDHRVVDGALGAMYLKTLVGFLEDPVMMLA
jgi:pyruvate dehydrogenase E2 component (dihydrolipoamide acetyltransferase)